MRHIDIDMSNAECRDCASANRTNPNKESCLAVKLVRQKIERILAENDVHVPMLTFEPDFDGKASQCPGFKPSREYLAELARLADDADAMYREDTDRLMNMGRLAQW